jgi:hypothetical protein
MTKRIHFPLTTAQQRRLLFETWEASGNVTLACRTAHVGRRTFYYWKPRFDAGGYAALSQFAPMAPKLPHRTIPPLNSRSSRCPPSCWLRSVRVVVRLAAPAGQDPPTGGLQEGLTGRETIALHARGVSRSGRAVAQRARTGNNGRLLRLAAYRSRWHVQWVDQTQSDEERRAIACCRHPRLSRLLLWSAWRGGALPPRQYPSAARYVGFEAPSL